VRSWWHRHQIASYESWSKLQTFSITKGFQKETEGKDERDACTRCVGRHSEWRCVSSRHLILNLIVSVVTSAEKEREREGGREEERENPQSRSCKCRVMPASFRIMGLRVRYLPRRETLCMDLRILRICSRVARWGRIRWYFRTTPIRRNALIMARSRLDHGSRSVVLIVSLCLRTLKFNARIASRSNRVLMDSQAVSIIRSVTECYRHYHPGSFCCSYLQFNP